jgi:hypothetical protein
MGFNSGLKGLNTNVSDDERMSTSGAESNENGK